MAALKLAIIQAETLGSPNHSPYFSNKILRFEIFLRSSFSAYEVPFKSIPSEIICYGLNEFPPLNSNAEILTPKHNGIGRWGLWEVLSHEAGSHRIEIHVL